MGRIEENHQDGKQKNLMQIQKYWVILPVSQASITLSGSRQLSIFGCKHLHEHA